eukprot:CAMPEP_0118998780 /NCGR_PEP_ID=MMETSP1173-20130426/63245_1 /TAXON_ID=1034831 /ORGANISM="Rhizochromulina marina cf, Strain CCMP1243" /LENGTH=752 /DNA_ID=CAMNT_0006950279 /DNA_START=20 /DNA_END=2278 /DNA_ORIENTATION=-
MEAAAEPEPAGAANGSAAEAVNGASGGAASSEEGISQAMLEAQRAAEEEVGDVTALFEAAEPVNGSAPRLLEAAANSGNAQLISRSKSQDTKTLQLDTLLAKASQYSAFIRNSQEQAQETFDRHAQSQMETETDGKKRKKGAGAEKGKKKKAKTETGELQDATQRMKDSRENKAAVEFWQPPNLKGTLKSYQLEGLRWLTTLYENGLSGILADEMGLGKTIQVIALIAYLRTRNVRGPFIIAAPLATLPNWMNEFRKWLPEMPALLYHGSKAARTQMREEYMPLGALGKDSTFPVIVTSFEICIIDRRQLEKYRWQYLIVDEGQRVKNRNCRLIRELKCLDTQNRLLLSGTPIQNTLEELWSLLNFVNPTIFDNLEVFQSWFGFRNIGKETQVDDIVGGEREQAIVTKLHEILRPFLLRRLKKDVLIDMPPKKEVVVYTPLSVLQRDYYSLCLKGELREALAKMGIHHSKEMSQINQNMNLRKICNHPFLFGEPEKDGQPIGVQNPEILVHGSGKFTVMDRMLRHLKKNGHQVLIFSQMSRVLDILEDYLLHRQWKYCRIDGSVKVDERQRQMDEFNTNPDIFVFMLSTRAGGLGINLQAADTCIIFDSDWNPHQDSQAQDRCHRIGQTKPVVVYRMICTGTVEVELMQKQFSKKKLERMAITGGQFSRPGQRSDGEFSVERLRTLLDDDVASMQERASIDDKTVGISEQELELIMDRKQLFAEPCLIPAEGSMYDIVQPAEKGGGILGGMD